MLKQDEIVELFKPGQLFLAHVIGEQYPAINRVRDWKDTQIRTELLLSAAGPRNMWVADLEYASVYNQLDRYIWVTSAAQGNPPISHIVQTQLIPRGAKAQVPLTGPITLSDLPHVKDDWEVVWQLADGTELFKYRGNFETVGVWIGALKRLFTSLVASGDLTGHVV